MTVYPRLVAQLHQVEADSPAQADEIARIRADAVNAGMRVLGHGSAWAPAIVDLDSEEGGLDDIVDRAYLLDEADGVTAYVPLNESPVFELLLAWRDAAVKAALQAAVPASIFDELASIREDAATAINDGDDLAVLRRIRSTACRIADGLNLTGVEPR